MQAPLGFFSIWSLHTPGNNGYAGRAASSPKALRHSSRHLTTSPSQATFLPKRRSCHLQAGFWREDKPTATLQGQPGSCWGGGWGERARPPRSWGTKAGSGVYCHAGVALRPPPSTGTTMTPFNLTLHKFRFQRKKTRFVTFPVQIPLLCVILAQLNTQGRKNTYTHCSFRLSPCRKSSPARSRLCQPLFGTPTPWTPNPSRPRSGNAQSPRPSHLATRSLGPVGEPTGTE